MRLLVLLLVLSFISLTNSAVFDDSPQLRLRYLQSKFRILDELLLKECPGYGLKKRDLADSQTLEIKVLEIQVQRLTQQFIACTKGKLSTKTASASVTTSTPSCPSSDGDSVFNIQLISYSNPTNKKASGVLCNPDGSPCDISLEICVSPINSSSCEFYHHVTDNVGHQSNINLLEDLTNLTNPLEVNLGNRTWQGAHVHITALERNPANSLRVYHEVDEFSYELTDVQGSPHRLVTLHGKRATDKTELVVMFTVLCPLPSKTTTAAPSTALPSTTAPSTALPSTAAPSTTLPSTAAPSTALPSTTAPSPPLPPECVTATNLTQSWRLDHSGGNIKEGGPHSASDGYACDMYDMGWFRFTGAAGTHMLNTCPQKYSCGTYVPFWTDETPPQVVGVRANITFFGMNNDNCQYESHPMQVMRCSLNTDHDLIYKYVGTYYSPCQGAFCGMN